MAGRYQPGWLAPRFAMVVGAAALAAFGAGCGDVYAELCDRGAQCRGGSDRDVEACIIDLEAKGEVAEVWGCDPHWDAYIECLDRRGACMGDRLTGCDDEKERWRRCIP